MTGRDQRGFTLIEVMIAVVVLAIGVTALVGSSAVVTRMIGQGKVSTQAVQAISQRLEQLRATAVSTTPNCTALAAGSATSANGIVTTWTITANGELRTIRVIVTYPTTGGTDADTVSTILRCL
jgi:prepilin-type N-terminal cleavage/methylation domain-containing protein